MVTTSVSGSVVAGRVYDQDSGVIVFAIVWLVSRVVSNPEL